MDYFSANKKQLLLKYDKLMSIYNDFKNKNLNLNMARGKPSLEQLELSEKILDIKIEQTVIDNIDIRNYGCLSGLPSVKKLFSSLFNANDDEIFIGGNSSLNLMHDLIANLMLLPSSKDNKPWGQNQNIKFLCPVPGYDRHFSICEKFNIKMININMSDDGPNMDQIENLVSQDESIKGIWCVPQYSNPGGVIYSDDVVRRMANLKPLAPDFKIFWDNAYFIHHLYDEHKSVLDIFKECKKNHCENMLYIFYSTSKITLPGAGISFLVSSSENIRQITKWAATQTIGFDKVNQLRHLLFFKNNNAILDHMKKHAEILKPKFQIVDKILSENLGPYNLASWSRPLGGYFISLDTLKGCAKRVVALCKNLGVTLTDAGATFPYGFDENDQNIRIAPSFPSLDELIIATKSLCLSIKLASLEKLIF